MHRPLRPLMLSVLALLFACFTSSAMAAGECAADADCPEGFSCQAVGGSSCGGAQPVDPNGDPIPVEPCEPETYYACVPPPPPPCAADSDCPTNQVCVSYSYDVCSGGGSSSGGGACDPNSGACAPVIDSGECTTESESYCVPRFFAPCEAAADCGPGFDCVEDTYTVCSGGGVVDPDTSSSGSDPVPPDEGTCETQTADTKYCKLQEISCADGQACPEGLTCETYEGGGSSSGASTCTIDAAGNEVCDTEPSPEPPPSVSACVPPEWSYWFGSADATTSNGGSSGSDSGNPFDDLIGGATGRGDVESAPISGGTSGGSSSGGTSGGTSGGANADGGGNSDDGGCQVVSARHSGQAPWGVLGLAFGLLVATRLRRRR
jgi:hypothetical protein